MNMQELLNTIISALEEAKRDLGITDVRISNDNDCGFVVETNDTLVDFSGEVYPF